MGSAYGRAEKVMSTMATGNEGRSPFDSFLSAMRFFSIQMFALSCRSM